MSDAGQDAPSPVDGGGAQPIDGRCPVGSLRVEALLINGPTAMPGLGSLFVEGRRGDEVFGGPHRGDGTFDLCFPVAEGPLQLSFIQNKENHILDVDGNFDSEVWAPGEHPLPPSRPEPARFVQSTPDSRFVVQWSTNVVETVEESPFMAPCRGLLTDCRVRFLEVDALGTLLGGAQFEYRLVAEPEIVLDSTDSTLGESAFEVMLPDTGLLAGLPLTEVRPLDCRGPAGPAWPGDLDTWRCTFAGTATVTSTSDGVARGTLLYVTGPSIVTDTVVAHFGSEEMGLEAFAFAPCCGDGTPRLELGEASVLEGSGSTQGDIGFEVDAPGYAHAFAYMRTTLAYRVWDFQQDGRISVPAGGLPERYAEFWPDTPLQQMWVGAITTEGAAPWADGRPTRMVRRRVLP